MRKRYFALFTILFVLLFVSCSEGGTNGDSSDSDATKVAEEKATIEVLATEIAAQSGSEETSGTATAPVETLEPSSGEEVATEETPVLSPENGTITIGDIELVAPAESLIEPVPITAEELTDQIDENTLPEGTELISPLYEITADAELFSGEVGVTLPLDGDTTLDEEEHTFVARYSDGRWVELPTIVNTTDGFARAVTTQFSIFGVFRDVLGQRPEIANIVPVPAPYVHFSLDDGFARDINLNVLVDDPAGRVEEAEAWVRFYTNRGLITVDAVRFATNAAWSLFLEGKPQYGAVGTMTKGPATRAGYDSYSIIVPVTQWDFTYAAGVQKIRFDVTLKTDGRDIQDSYELLVSNKAIDYRPEFPANGDLVYQPSFRWDVTEQGDLDNIREVRICTNPELKDNFWLGGCKEIEIKDPFQREMSGDKIPSLSPGKYWWGIVVRQPPAVGTEDLYRSKVNLFEVTDDLLEILATNAFLNVIPGEVEPGVPFVITGSRFEPEETVIIEGVPVESDLETVAGSSGRFRLNVDLPLETEAGKYTAVATGSTSGAEAEVTFSVRPSTIEAPDEESEDVDEEAPEGAPTSALPQPQTRENSSCLSYGDLPPLDLVLSRSSSEGPLRIELPVEDSCGDYPPEQWTVVARPWIDAIEDLYIDAEESAVVVVLSPNASLGDYGGEILVQYPGETDGIAATTTVAVTEQEFAWPPNFLIEYRTTQTYGRNEEATRSCTSEQRMEAVEVVSGRYARYESITTWACNTGENRQRSFEGWRDLFTGQPLANTCTDCFQALGPRPGEGTVWREILGNNVHLFSKQETRTTYPGEGWVSVTTYTNYYDVATGVNVLTEWVGYSHFNGEDYGDWEQGTTELVDTNIPLGQDSQPLSSGLIVDWLGQSCGNTPPSQAVSVEVVMTDDSESSYVLVLDPDGSCGVASGAPPNGPDLVMYVSSGNFIGLMEGSVSYYSLVNQGHLDIRTVFGDEDDRSAFLEFLLLNQ